MNIRTTILALLLSASSTLMAAGLDTLKVSVQEHSSLLIGLRNEVYDNPAMQSMHFVTSLNSLYAGYKHSDASLPVRLEDGDGYDYGFGHIDAYLHKGKATIWGNVEYRNGSYKNIQFSETSDYMTVYPYVMGDTVGGDSHREYYHFLGGFSYPVGRFNIGGEGEYTAIMEYRTRDPRPKNLTGDLRVKVGASFDITKKRVVALAVTGRKYKQTNDVEIHNEVSMPVIYHLTGLGTDYYRFRGSNTETYYKGYSFGGLLDYAEKENRGLFGSVGYEYTNIDKIISTLNQLPMATLRKYEQTAKIGFNTNNDGNGYGLALTESWSKNRGKENIFGSAQNNIYPQISDADYYSLTRWSAGMQAVYQHVVKGKGDFGAKIDVAYSDYNERYHDPERLRGIKASALMAGMKLNGNLSVGKMMLSGNLSAGYEWSMSGDMDVPETYQSQTLFKPIAHYFNYLDSDRWNTAVSVEAGYDVKGRFMPFVRVGWQYARYIKGEHNTMLEISAGVKL